MVCHRMQPRAQPPEDHRPYLQFFLETSITGNIHLGKKGELYGPFEDDEIAPYAMEHATGLKPKHDDYLKSSQLCGTCHTVALPNIDRPLGKPGSAHGPDELTRSEVVPLFYNRDAAGLPRGWIARQKSALMSLAGRFNADRMVMDYVNNCYLPAAGFESRAMPNT